MRDGFDASPKGDVSVVNFEEGALAIAFPDAEAMFKGSYERLGDDLAIVGEDGFAHLIVNYFASDAPPALVSANGGMLAADTVARLAGPVAPGMVAQAGGVTGQEQIGAVQTADGTITVQRANGVIETLNDGDPVFQGDVIATGDGSGVGLVFIDGTVFTMTANARFVLDELIYDPASTDNSMVVDIVQGTFAFVTGQVAGTGGMTIETPVATMGIRGTTVTGSVESDTGVSVLGLAEDPGTGNIGSYVIFRKGTNEILAVVNQTDTTFTITSVTGQAFEAPKTPDDISFEQQILGFFNRVYENFLADPVLVPQGQDGEEGSPDETDATDGADGEGTEQQDGQNTNGPNGTITNFARATITDLIGDSSGPDLGSGFGTQPLLSNAPESSFEFSLPSSDFGIPDNQVALNALSGSFTIDEDSNATGRLAVSSGSGGLTYVVTRQPSVGVVSVDANGNFTYDPQGAFNGLTDGESRTVVFTYQATDGSGNTSAPADVSIVVEGVNDAPQITLPNLAGLATGEDQPIQLFGFEITDPENSTLTVGVTAQSTITLNGFNANGTKTAQLRALEAEFGNITFLVGDGVNDEAITLRAPAPVVTFLFTGFIYTPTPNNDQGGGISFSVSDGEFTSSSSVDVAISASEDAPVVTDVFVTSTGESTPVTGSFSGFDPDTGDTITFGLVSVPGQGTFTDNGNGTFTYNPGDAFEGLGEGESFTVTATYRATDSTGRTSNLGVVAVTIPGEADDPIAEDDAFSGNEDTQIVGNVLDDNGAGADSDPEGDSLSVVPDTITTANGGTVVLLADGSFTYDPASNFNGPDSFDYTLLDGNGGTDTGTANITVNAVNDDPVAEDDAFSGNEDTQIIGNVLGENGGDADSDPDGDSLSVVPDTITTANGGTVVLLADGSFTYDPALNFNGPDSFEYIVRDGNDGSDTGTVNITVNPIDDSPDIQPDAPSGVTYTENGAPVQLLPTATFDEPDTAISGSSLSVTLTGGGAGDRFALLTPGPGNVQVEAGTSGLNVTVAGTIVGALIGLGSQAMTINFTAAATASAVEAILQSLVFDSLTDSPASTSRTANISFTEAGGSSPSDNVSVAIGFTPVNDAPTAPGGTTIVSLEDGSVVLTVANFPFSDVDAGDSLQVVKITGIPSQGVLKLNGVDVSNGAEIPVAQITAGNLTYVPDSNVSGDDADVFTYQVGDGTAFSDDANLFVDVTPVNDAPTAPGGTTIVSLEDGSVVLTVANFPFSDVDAGDSLQVVKITGVPSQGVLKLNGVDVADGAEIPIAQITAGNLTYVPDPNVNGVDADVFTYQVGDGTAFSGNANLFVDVTPVNDPPSISTSNAPDFDDGDGDGSAVNPGSITLINQVTASDPDLGETPTINAGTVSVAIVGETLNSGTAASRGFFASSFVTTGLGNGTSIGADLDNYSALQAGESLVFEVTFDVDSGPDTVSTSFQFKVDGDNDAPFGFDEDRSSGSIDEFTTADVSGDLKVIIGDYKFDDVDQGIGDPTFSLVPDAGNPTLPFGITFSFIYGDNGGSRDAVGIFASISEADFLALGASDDFNLTYTLVVDDNAGGVTNSGDVGASTMTLTIDGANDAPTAPGGTTITVVEEGLVALNVANFPFSDVDAGDTLQSIKITGIPTNGVLKLNGVDVANGAEIPVAQITAGNLTYAPDLNVSGADADSFTYQVSDGIEFSTDATLEINVTPVNDPPTTNDTTVTATEDTPFTFDLPDFPFSDPDAGDTLQSIQIVSGSGSGTLTLDGNAVSTGQTITAAQISAGQFRYTPSADVNGTGVTSYVFNVSDGTAASGNSTLSIDVTPANDTPTPQPDVTATDQNTVLNGNLFADNGSGVDSDPDGDTFTVTSLTDASGTINYAIGSPVNLGGGGILTVNANGTFTFDANGDFDFLAAGQQAAYNLLYQVTDTGGLQSSPATTATIQINGQNDLPTVDQGIDDQTVAEDGTLNFSVPADAFADVDQGDTLTLSAFLDTGTWVALPSWISFDGTDFTANPTDAEVGSYTFVVVGNDSAGAAISTSFQLDVTPVNDAPEIDVSGLDAEGANLLNNGNFEAQGPQDNVTSVTGWTVNSGNVDLVDGPNVNSPAAGEGVVSLDLHGNVIGEIQQSFTTVIGQTYTVTFLMAGDPANGETIADVTASAAGISQSFSYDTTGQSRPTLAYETKTFTFTATATSTTLVFSSDDVPSNSGPYLDDVRVFETPRTTPEDTPVTLSGISIGDVDSDSLTVTASVLNGSLALTGALTGITQIDSDGSDGSIQFSGSPADITAMLAASIRYTPTANFNGTDTLTLSVDDGTAAPVNQNVTITVNPVNDPATTTNNTVNATEDTTYTFQTADFPFNDVEGDAPTKILFNSLPSNGTLSVGGTVITSANLNIQHDWFQLTSGNITYTPNLNGEGIGFDSFGFLVATAGAGVFSNLSTMTIDVTNTPDPPTVSAASDPAAIDDGDGNPAAASPTGFLLTDRFTSSDPDPADTPTVDETSVSVTVKSNPAGISVTGAEFQLLGTTGNNSTLTVDKDNFSALQSGESVVFTVTFDVVSGVDRVTRSFDITVNGDNDAPYLFSGFSNSGSVAANASTTIDGTTAIADADSVMTWNAEQSANEGGGTLPWFTVNLAGLATLSPTGIDAVAGTEVATGRQFELFLEGTDGTFSRGDDFFFTITPDFDNTDAVGGVITGDGNSNYLADLAGTGFTFDGGAGADFIDARGGNDVILGSLGDDVIDGGSGTDILNNAAFVTNRVNVNLNTGQMLILSSAGAVIATQIISNIENASGGLNEDTFRGNASDNFFEGNGNPDDLITYDYLAGLTSADGISFVGKGYQSTLGGAATADDAITGLTAASIALVGTDTISNIEIVIGTDYDDEFRPGPSPGDSGNSQVRVMDGGAGIDTLIYDNPNHTTGGVTITLGPGVSQVNNDGFGTGPTALNFENIIGGSGNDVLTGEAGVNVLLGGDGDDRLNGGPLDTVSDTLDGQEGSDTYVISGNQFSDIIVDSGTGGSDIDTIQLQNGTGTIFEIANTFSAASSGIEVIDGQFVSGDILRGDTDAVVNFDFTGIDLQSVSQIHGRSFNDTIIGSAGFDDIRGFDGNDTIVGNGGGDVIDGGGGDDKIIVQAGFGSVDGGAGTEDTLESSVVDFDLNAISNAILDGIEILELTNSQTLSLDFQDVIDLSDTVSALISGATSLPSPLTDDGLVVNTNSDATLNLLSNNAGSWAENTSANEAGFDVFEFSATGGGILATVFIEDDTTNNVILNA